MPPLVNAFEPELNEGIIKKGKYDGIIHKVLEGNTYTADLEWVLLGTDKVIGLFGRSISGINYLDVLAEILEVDRIFDTTPGCYLLFSPHAEDPRASPAFANARGSQFVNFRIVNRAEALKSLEQKIVAKHVKIKIETDGYIARLPINMRFDRAPLTRP